MLVTVDQVSGKSFDYIIVGGGTAGLTIAARLTEDSSLSVLVLEAGGDNLDDPAILTPAAFASHFGNPKYDWIYQTEPQENAFGRNVPFPRGKGLGGSSAINFFCFHNPAKSDINALEKLGNAGWNWDLLKTYYAKSMHFVPETEKSEAIKYDPKLYGTDGPLTIAYPAVLSGLEIPYHKALKNMGVEHAKAPFGGDTLGTWLTPVSVDPKRRTRSYAANMYYQPNASRKNLTVLTLAHVSKVVFKKDGQGVLTATAVEFLHEGKKHSATVNKEVVLSAGTIASPQVLELSGIGEKSVLQKAGVETILELPGVGNNIQEHIFCGASYKIREDVDDKYLTFDCLADPEQLKAQLALYEQGKGVFGMSLNCTSFLPLNAISTKATELQKKLSEEVHAAISANKYTTAEQKRFEVQLEHIADQEPSLEIILAPGFATVTGSTNKKPEPGKKYLTMYCFINHPFSRGTIHIKSTDPLEHPSIDPRYFEQIYDLHPLVEMFKFNRRLVQQEPLKSILTDVEALPGSEVQTDEQIADYIKGAFMTTYHTIGSCSMLPLKDGGVVDTKLKVYNTTNVRVCDLSIVPLHIGAHTQATAYALGELGADIILGKAFQ